MRGMRSLARLATCDLTGNDILVQISDVNLVRPSALRYASRAFRLRIRCAVPSCRPCSMQQQQLRKKKEL